MLYVFFIKNVTIIILIILIIALIVIIEIKEYFYTKYGITVSDAIHLINNRDIIVLDFRTKIDFEKYCIPNSINIPYEDIGLHTDFFKKNKNKTLIIIENKRYFNKQIISFLNNFGCKNVMYIANGIDEWCKNGLPINRRY